MKITVTSVLVDDQEKALAFYTQVLGFVPKADVPLGGEHRWLTVVSPDQPDGTELLLEPDEHPAARPFKDALVRDGIPFTSFAVPDVHARSRVHAADRSPHIPRRGEDVHGERVDRRHVDLIPRHDALRHSRQPRPAARPGCSASLTRTRHRQLPDLQGRQVSQHPQV